MMVLLFGIMGLAFDASYMYFVKRRMQTAADAAALGAAQELLRGHTDAITLAARKDAALNQFTHATDQVDVTVNHPPISGPRAGSSRFVEVIVAQPRPTWFLRVLQVESATVRARAVAGLGDADGCVYALNRDTSNQNNGFFANGTTNSTFQCGVFSNANFRAVGGGCVVTPTVNFTGDYSNSDDDCGPGQMDRGVPMADPVRNRYTLPAPSACGFTNYKETSGPAVVLDPGVYCGGIEIGGSVPSATFRSGTYVLVGGGLKLGSGVSATGVGVTFFNTFPNGQTNKYEPIVINTSGTVSFSAPTSDGPTKALLFYQNPAVSWSANNGSLITASSTSVFEGILYFPTTDLTYAGNSTSSGSGGYTMLIAYNIKVSGSAQVNADFSSLGGNSPLQMATFVE
jgi:hypothetical protein